jgi:mRNA interferase RelE/StbE
MIFRVEFTNKAEKNLRKIPEPFKKKLFVAACALSKNPFPRGLEKLTDRDNTYRIRIGQYRIVWFVDYKNNVVWIVNIDKRPKVY